MDTVPRPQDDRWKPSRGHTFWPLGVVLSYLSAAAGLPKVHTVLVSPSEESAACNVQGTSWGLYVSAWTPAVSPQGRVHTHHVGIHSLGPTKAVSEHRTQASAPHRAPASQKSLNLAEGLRPTAVFSFSRRP